MSTSKRQTFTNLGIIAGIVLGAILLGKITGEMAMVLDILKAISLVLIGITILVTIHELGHFLTAKAFGMRVEAFSIGFPPKIFSFTKGDTEYQIGATPLGGYVKISGMIDESMDTDHLQSEPKSYEYRSKPAWQRLVVMVGGVVMNVILGVFIFSMVKYGYGDERLPMSEVKYGVQVFENSLGEMLGFKTGDKLVSYKGEQFEYFDDYANPNNLVEDEGYYEVERDGKIVRIDVPVGIQDNFSDDSLIISLFIPDMPAIVNIAEGGPAEKAGLQSGDQIVEIDSMEISTFSDLQNTLKGKGNFDTVQLAYLRNGNRIETAAQLDSGFLRVAKDMSIFKTQKETYSFLGSFIPGTKQAFSFLFTNVQGLKQVAVGNASASKSVMGPIQIAKRYLDIFNQNGLEGFMILTASLSMILAFVNMLPIPGLDGGHVMFLLIEMVMRRELPVKVRIGAQYVGMIFILLLMLFILGNDVRSFF